MYWVRTSRVGSVDSVSSLCKEGQDNSTVVCQKLEVSLFRFSNWLQCAIGNCFVLCGLFSFNMSRVLAMAWKSPRSHESCPFFPSYLVSSLQESRAARCWNLQQGHSSVPPACYWRMSRERLSYRCSVCVSAQLDMDKQLRNSFFLRCGHQHCVEQFV